MVRERELCAWCGTGLPERTTVGRPREYCSRSCRQRAYENRQQAAADGLSEDAVIVRRAQLEDLQDRLFTLRCAVEDLEAVLGEDASRGELERVCREVVHSAGTLNRLWLTPATQSS